MDLGIKNIAVGYYNVDISMSLAKSYYDNYFDRRQIQRIMYTTRRTRSAR